MDGYQVVAGGFDLLDVSQIRILSHIQLHWNGLQML